MAIWDVLNISKPKNGDRKDGKVYMNGVWVTETDPLLKGKVYNNNVGVPIPKEIVDKYKQEPANTTVVPAKNEPVTKEEPSTFMDRLMAKDSKGNSTLNDLGQALITIGSKGWSNNGLGEGATQLGKSLSAKTSTMVQTAAKDEALKVFNDPNATPQAKMAAVMKAKDAGVDDKDFDTMLAAIGGVKQVEGNNIDPYTGKVTQVLAPTDDPKYKAEDRANATQEAIKLTAAQEEEKQKYVNAEIKLRADIAAGVATQAQKDALELQKASLEKQGIIIEGQEKRQDAKDANTATRDQAKANFNEAVKYYDGAVASIQEAEAALIKMDNLETLVQGQSDSDWKNGMDWLADKASVVLTTEQQNRVNSISGYSTQLGIAMHPGGVMTDADLVAYKAVILNPSSSRSEQLARLAEQEEAFRVKLNNADTKLKELEIKRDDANKLWANAGSKQTGTSNPAPASSGSNTAFKPPAFK